MTVLPVRHVARLVVLDAAHSILLVRYREDRPGRPRSYWVPPGGALETGEAHREAAARELSEETGLVARVGKELWTRRFELDLPQGRVDQLERYFLVQLDVVAPLVRNTSPEMIEEHRWWSLQELQVTDEVIYPDGFIPALSEHLA
jgi:8-oxo-dGTP pyrophosphatase MutT (NUDIX family)